MPHLVRPALDAAAAAGLSGCVGFSTADPYPVYGNPVNPTPVATYVVQCQTGFGLLPPPVGDAASSCRQGYEPARGSVVRARN